MEQRMDISEILPESYKAVYALNNTLNNSFLSPTQKHLIKIRASQINSCAFCIDMHTKEAIKAGEKLQRILLISAWKETSLFCEEEQAILKITEEVTLIHQHGLSEETYREAQKHFSTGEIAEIIMMVVVINTWNRIAVSTRLAVPGA